MTMLSDVAEALEKAGLTIEKVTIPRDVNDFRSREFIYYKFTTSKGKDWIIYQVYGKIYVGYANTQKQVDAGAVPYTDIASFYDPQDAADFILIKW